MSNNVIWVNRNELISKGIEKIKKTEALLDIGCGIEPRQFMIPRIYIGCEPCEEYVEILRKNSLEKENDIFEKSVCIFLHLNWEEVLYELNKYSVDTVYLIDVIEHLEKDEGKRLLKLTEKIATKQIVIFTPIGFIEQKILHGRDSWGLNGVVWQEHKSGWLLDDFDETWEITACNDFHVFNNIGEKLEKPIGAFWAIKNIGDEKTNKDFNFIHSENFLEKMIENEKKLKEQLFEEKENIRIMKCENQKNEKIIWQFEEEIAFMKTRYSFFEKIFNLLNKRCENGKNV